MQILSIYFNNCLFSFSWCGCLFRQANELKALECSQGIHSWDSLFPGNQKKGSSFWIYKFGVVSWSFWGLQMLILKMRGESPPTQIIMVKLIKASFFICVWYLTPPKAAAFKRSALDVASIDLRVGGFQMGDLAGKIGGVTGAEHKHSKLVPPERIAWLQQDSQWWPYNLSKQR